MNSGFTVRTAEEADYEELAVLVNSAYRGESSRQGWTTETDIVGGQRTDKETLREELQDPNREILCLRSQASVEILACVTLEKLHSKRSYCYLGMLTVKPHLQTQGIGKYLMNAAEEFARNWGALYITLGVINTRSELIAWYERRGYKKNGETKPFPYGEEKFGIPKQVGLFFVIFEKQIGLHA